MAEAVAPGASVASVARLNDVNANLVFKWIRHARAGWPDRRRASRTGVQPSVAVAAIEPPAFVPVRIVDVSPSAAPVAEAPAGGLANAPAREPSARKRCAVRVGAIAIALPSGARIEVGADVEEAALRVVLSAMKTF
ncbi:MAG: transposase [Amphiplicatus sp.]|nr:transposase [Amphiplicatus sp.]